MKKFPWIAAGAVAIYAGVLYAQDAAQPEFKTVTEKASYAIGLNIGNSVTRDDLEVDARMLVRGLTDALSKKDPALSEEEMTAAMQAFQQEAVAKMTEKRTQAAEENVKKGEAFLAANKQQAGVQTTDSGLQYKVLKEGAGPVPKPTDTVKTHYEGKLLDGTVFDSSLERGEPATFPVNGVIAGWTEALQKMKVGSKYQLFVPAKLAYGERGAGGAIGPNETLIFEVELLDIEKPQPQQQQQLQQQQLQQLQQQLQQQP